MSPSPQVWLLITTVVTTVGGLLGTLLLIRQQGGQTRTTDSQQMIDQLQENAKASDEKHDQEIARVEARHRREMGELRGEMAVLRRQVGEVHSRDLALFDYASLLRWHIEQRKDPPPPPWPQVLMQRRPPTPDETKND